MTDGHPPETPVPCQDVVGQPWEVPHQTMLQWLADAGRYQWLKQHFTQTRPPVGLKGQVLAPTWHLPTALLLRFRAPDLDQAIDAARRYDAQDQGSRIWVGEDPH